MRFPTALLFFLVLVLAAVFLFAQVQLGEAADNGEDTRLLPKIPTSKGEQCVESTEVMRRRHMEFILHQRDRTVHEGIRTEKYRFVNCINCHAQARADGSYPRHTDGDHFCESCHRFSSVSMDCFQCHADRPVEAYTSAQAIDKIIRRFSMGRDDEQR